MSVRQYGKQCYFLSGASADFLGLTATSTTVVHLTWGLGVGADFFERRSVAEVGINANKLTTVARGHALHIYISFALLGTVATRTI